MPQISVIVPVYKVEPYLRRCVDSILAQTFTDFELILVDDGSPDNCGTICDEYAAKDSRVRVIHQKNGGLSAARNTGIDWAFANSDSRWLSFIDSDDWVHPQYLEYLYLAAEKSGAEASACYYSTESQYRTSDNNVSAKWRVYAFEDFFCLQRKGINAIIACGKLYKKDLFSETRYPTGKVNEDLFITPKVLFRCSSIAVIDAVLYFYYQSDGSIMRSPWNERRLDEIEASEELIRFTQENCSTKVLNKAIRRYLGVLEKQVREASLSPLGSRKIQRYLVWKYRSELIRNRSICPLKEYRYMYEQAFPKISWLCWTCIGVWGRIKRIGRRDKS